LTWSGFSFLRSFISCKRGGTGQMRFKEAAEGGVQ
jgi:hypothetical protein